MNPVQLYEGIILKRDVKLLESLKDSDFLSDNNFVSFRNEINMHSLL